MPVTPSVHSVRDQIANRLRNELLGGQYEPGTPLREEGLADRFGVSRMPVRNALQDLVNEGLLVAKRNCGVTVAPPPAGEMHELLTVLRIQIEMYALRLGLHRLTERHFDSLHAILDEMAVACRRKDDPAVIDADFAFHQTLLCAAGLDDILPVWKGVTTRTRDYHIWGNRTHADYGVIPFVHERLIEVFRTGDVDAAVGALASHIENGEFDKTAFAAWNADRGRESP